MTLDEKLDQVINDVNEIKTALKGYNGHEGLMNSFEDHCNSDHEFQADYYKFKRTVITIFAFLVGSGALGIGVWQLLI